MAAGRAVEWVQHVCDALNDRDLGAVAEVLADDCSYAANGAPHWNATGSTQVLSRFQSLLTAFPDQRADVINVVGDDTSAAAEIHIVENHTGPLATPLGTFPPTGLAIDEVVAYFVQIDAQGKGISIRHYYDAAPLTLAVMSGTPSAG
jgi:steroid delta-isomerase-like uncharacterized protein